MRVRDCVLRQKTVPDPLIHRAILEEAGITIIPCKHKLPDAHDEFLKKKEGGEV